MDISRSIIGVSGSEITMLQSRSYGISSVASIRPANGIIEGGSLLFITVISKVIESLAPAISSTHTMTSLTPTPESVGVQLIVPVETSIVRPTGPEIIMKFSNS